MNQALAFQLGQEGHDFIRREYTEITDSTLVKPLPEDLVYDATLRLLVFKPRKFRPLDQATALYNPIPPLERPEVYEADVIGIINPEGQRYSVAFIPEVDTVFILPFKGGFLPLRLV